MIHNHGDTGNIILRTRSDLLNVRLAKIRIQDGASVLGTENYLNSVGAKIIWVDC